MRTNTPRPARADTCYNHPGLSCSRAATCERRLRPYLPLALRPYAALRQAWPSSDPLGDRGPVLPLPPRGAWHALAVGDAVDQVLPLRRAWLGLGLGSG